MRNTNMNSQTIYIKKMSVLTLILLLSACDTLHSKKLPTEAKQHPNSASSGSVNTVHSKKSPDEINQSPNTLFSKSSDIVLAKDSLSRKNTNVSTANSFNNRTTADPFIFKKDKSLYYLFVTSGNGIHVPTYSATNMKNWNFVGDAMPELPSWATHPLWAPEIMEIDKRYLLYYTARYQLKLSPSFYTPYCIGVAIAAKIEGPYVDQSNQPLICELAEGGGGSIDANPYRNEEDGKLYVIWKNSTGSQKAGTFKSKIRIATLSSDGTSLTSKPVDLIAADQTWEGSRHIEAPTLVKHNKKYYLFYSAGAGTSYRYAVGYAVSDYITGPYKKYANNPILHTNQQLLAPGHQGVFRDDNGAYHMVFHTVHRGQKGRHTVVYNLRWNNDIPEIIEP